MKIEKLTPQIGAVIREINLNGRVTDALIEKIKETFHENLVIFIEEQNISPKQFIRFSEHFGELGVYPFVKGMNDFPEIVEVRKKKDEKINFGGLWHTDTSYLPEPPASSMLYAVEIPPVGGDTLFSNMYLAYENLTPAYKAILSNLRGYNTSEKADAAVTRTHRIADSPKNTAVFSPLVLAEQCIGKMPFFGKSRFITEKIDFFISPAYLVPPMSASPA